MYSPSPILIAPETIAANPVSIIIKLLPIDAKVAAATPTNSVNVEINPSFNPKIILRILPPPTICSSCLELKCYHQKVNFFLISDIYFYLLENEHSILALLIMTIHKNNY
jgi:hypothetical protein